jgi:hypothetical protein
MGPMSLSIVGKFVKILQLGFLLGNLEGIFFLLEVCKNLPQKKTLLK